jgi:hypothetical protein
MRILNKTTAFAVFFVAVSMPAFGAGCDGKPLQFEDKFTDLKNWPDIPKEASPSVSGGRLTLTSTNGLFVYALYHGDVFEDADYCITFKLLKSTNKDPEHASAGLDVYFWAKDDRNKYVLSIAPETKLFRLVRLVANRLIGLENPPTSLAIKGPGEQNIVRVSMRGAQAKYYINDRELVPDGPLAAHPPDGGGLIGFGVQSVADSQYIWEVDSIKVTR